MVSLNLREYTARVSGLDGCRCDTGAGAGRTAGAPRTGTACGGAGRATRRAMLRFRITEPGPPGDHTGGANAARRTGPHTARALCAGALFRGRRREHSTSPRSHAALRARVGFEVAAGLGARNTKLLSRSRPKDRPRRQDGLAV